MGAQVSFIFVAESVDPEFHKLGLDDLEPRIRQTLGCLVEVTVHNYETDILQTSQVCGRPCESVPSVSGPKIVTFNAEARRGGCVMLTREGRFSIITIALDEIQDATEFFRDCWYNIGERAVAALMGEELEVNEDELDYLVCNGRISPRADLCQAAIVKANPGASSASEGKIVDYGGVLLRA